MLDAALAARNGAPRARVADRFLNHRDQHFRLSYVLGPWRSEGSAEDFSFDEENDFDVEEVALVVGEPGDNGDLERGRTGGQSCSRRAVRVADRGFVGLNNLAGYRCSRGEFGEAGAGGPRRA